MPHSTSEPTDLSCLWEVQPTNTRVGRIVRLSEEGHAFVDYPGNTLGAIEARALVGIAPADPIDCPVLLVFESGDPTLPIIIGIVGKTLQGPTPKQEITMNFPARPNVVVDGRHIVFDASGEIVLRCGRSSVTLRNDGKIVIKGTEIVSRSSGNQKIRGAAVQIN